MTPCRAWTGRVDREGYGRLGRDTYAHRAAWEEANGPILDGLTIDHLCRNRACVNVEHMELVTRAENVLRGESPAARNARRERCERGHVFETRRDRGKVRRFCRTCRNTTDRARYAARRAA